MRGNKQGLEVLGCMLFLNKCEEIRSCARWSLDQVLFLPHNPEPLAIVLPHCIGDLE